MSADNIFMVYMLNSKEQVDYIWMDVRILKFQRIILFEWMALHYQLIDIIVIIRFIKMKQYGMENRLLHYGVILKVLYL